MAAMEGLDALRISEEKKKYIIDLLNPVLEEMVAECIHRMPEDPVPFMLEWLEQKKIDEEEKQLSPEEKDRLMQENKNLTESVGKVKSQMQEAAMMAAATDEKSAGNDEEPEEEEDDDELDEPPPDFFKEQPSAKARQSVSAEAYGEWNTKKAFVAPVITKTDEQKDRLRTVLSKSFLFMNLEDNDLNIVIGAMKEVPCTPGHRVITQGDDGNFLFVIESGSFDCLIKKDEKEEVVKTCTTGDFFGELALLYNCPRKASVDSKEQGVVWQLDRDTFNHIVKEAAQKKRTRYDSFLAKVPILQSMDAYERSQLADALRSETFSDGQIIMSQGEVGHKFYIIEEGEVKATKGGVEVMTYGDGDYFGELALIRDQPRAATCTCSKPGKLLSLDSASFKRLLNVNDLMERSHARYNM
jgi:cAMP-dependent protein kinase regulator